MTTTLFDLCQNKDYDTPNSLQDKFNADKSDKGYNKNTLITYKEQTKTALSWSLIYNNTTMIWILLDPEQNPDNKNPSYFFLTYFSQKPGKDETIYFMNYITDRHSDFNFNSRLGSHIRSYTPFTLAIFWNNDTLVEWLLQPTYEVNIFEIDGFGLSGLDYIYSHTNATIKNLIKNTLNQIQERLKQNKKIGYHETSEGNYESIMINVNDKKPPMIAGCGGLFGGGIYFGISPKQVSRKLDIIGYKSRTGRGIEAEVSMGNIYHILNQEDYRRFVLSFGDSKAVRREPLSISEFTVGGYNYNISHVANDVMFQRLLNKKYNSVYAHDDKFQPTDKDKYATWGFEYIQDTGPEFVVYHEDQVNFLKGFKVSRNYTKKVANWIDITSK